MENEIFWNKLECEIFLKNNKQQFKLKLNNSHKNIFFMSLKSLIASNLKKK